MNDERLNRHITHENLRLRSENSQLKHQMEAKDSMLQSKDAEILRLLNQIASDMVKRSDVDEIVKNAVAEEHDRMVIFYEEKMRKMAAEYEAIIASLKKKDNKGGKGNTGRRKKPNTETSLWRRQRTQTFTIRVVQLAASCLTSGTKRIKKHKN